MKSLNLLRYRALTIRRCFQLLDEQDGTYQLRVKSLRGSPKSMVWITKFYPDDEGRKDETFVIRRQHYDAAMHMLTQADKRRAA